MNFTTTLTSKYQLTLPKPVRDKLGVKKGVQFDIYPTQDGGFIGMPRKKIAILAFAGDLARLDDQKPWNEVRSEAERLAVEKWVQNKRPYDKNRSR